MTTEAVYDSPTASFTPSSTGTQAPPANAAALRAQTSSIYDDRGRLNQSIVQGVDPTSGSTASQPALTSKVLYDGRNNVVETDAPGGVVTKQQFDGAGRTIDATSGSASVVLTDVHTSYDANGDAILIATAQAQPAGGMRTSYVAHWYDAASRLTATADAGTSGGSPYVRPATAPPASNVLLLLSTFSYDAGGWLKDTTDANGVITDRQNDALGRVAQEFDNSVPNAATSADTNKLTAFGYDGLNHVVMTSVNNFTPGGSTVPQTTRYTYGGAAGAIGDNTLTQMVYPGGSKETDSYDNLGEVVQKTDRLGVVHQFSYDVEGHLLGDFASTIPANVDRAVEKLSYQYDALGRPTLFTSEGFVHGTWGKVNQVQRVYNGLGQVTTEYQEHNGAVTSNSYKVQYGYDQANNDSRLQRLVYPDSRTVWYGYDTGVDNDVSRVSWVADGTPSAAGQHLEAYSYLGLDQVVGRTLTEPGITEATTLDGFGRTQGVDWTQGTNHLDQYAYGYDYNGNVTLRRNLTNSSFTETFGYDQVGHLTAMTSSSTTFPSVTYTPDSQGKRTAGGVAFNADNESSANSYNADGGVTNLHLNSSLTTVQVVYDAWQRVASATTESTITNYRDDALGRRVTSSDAAGQTFYDVANNPLEERDAAGTVRTQYVWSGSGALRLVLRDRDADGNAATGRAGLPSTNLEQRLYTLSDGQQSATAIVGKNGAGAWAVAEHYAYGTDGAPAAFTPSWGSYVAGKDLTGAATSLDATNSRYGWEFLWHGQRYHAMYYAGQEIVSASGEVVITEKVAEGAGLYETASGGAWSDPQNARLLEPSGPSLNPYDPTGGETGFSGFVDRHAGGIAVGGTVVVATALTVATAGAFGPEGAALVTTSVALQWGVAGAVGGAFGGFGNAYAGGQSGWQLARSTGIGGLAGAVGGAVAGPLVGSVATLQSSIVAGAAGGAAGGAIQGAYGGYQAGGWSGTLEGAGTGAVFGGLAGAAFGGVAYGASRGLALFRASFVGEVAAQEAINSIGALEDWESGPSAADRLFARDAAWEADNSIGIHGNSAASLRTAYLYRLIDQDGNFLKWGITQNIATRYPKSFMADKSIIEFARGSRADMLRIERTLVETQPGPLNREPWAGSKIGGQQ